ncbi:MAG: glycosyl transferase family 1 [Flavobacteriales bacterium]|nr:glycosyl transferase family 1 [Flavobacteriales bacterium]
MNLLVISNYRDYHTTRPEADIFKKMSKLGVNITIMTYGESKHAKEFKDLGIKVIDFHPEKKFDKKEILKIKNTIIEDKINIVHAFSSKGSYAAIKAAKGLNVKLILYRGFTGNLEWWNPSSYLKHLNKRVDAIMCNSKGVKEYFDKQLFFKKDKAVTINKGHDTSWYAEYKPVDIKKELGLSNDAFLLINVANNRKMKGIPYLMKSVALLPKNKNIHLLLAGKGMKTRENLEILKQADCEDRVHFLGFRKDVLNVVAACDVFVLSSLFGESITKSVIEAMSLQKPAIITDIPGNVELIEDGKSGFVTPSKKPKAMAQAIVNMYNNPEKTKQMGVAAKSRIQNQLSSKQTVIQLKALYEKILAE